MTFYTDGSTLGTERKDAKGGYGIVGMMMTAYSASSEPKEQMEPPIIEKKLKQFFM